MRAPNYEFGGCEFESHQSFKIKFARVGELAYPSDLDKLYINNFK